MLHINWTTEYLGRCYLPFNIFNPLLNDNGNHAEHKAWDRLGFRGGRCVLVVCPLVVWVKRPKRDTEPHCTLSGKSSSKDWLQYTHVNKKKKCVFQVMGPLRLLVDKAKKKEQRAALKTFLYTRLALAKVKLYPEAHCGSSHGADMHHLSLFTPTGLHRYRTVAPQVER